MNKFDYVREQYGVPAEIGRRVLVNGKPGVIVEDRGQYIGVNFDSDEPGEVHSAHPTSGIEYGEMGVIRRLSPAKLRSKQRYNRYLEFCECFDSFIDYCRWDAEPERSWNRGY